MQAACANPCGRQGAGKTTPAEQLLALPFLQNIDDTLHAYQLSKRCNALRVMAEAVGLNAVHT